MALIGIFMIAVFVIILIALNDEEALQLKVWYIIYFIIEIISVGYFAAEAIYPIFQKMKRLVPDDSEDDSDEEENYREKKREPGAGPARIGQSIILNEDIYSMFFISTMRPAYLHYYQKIEGTDAENILT